MVGAAPVIVLFVAFVTAVTFLSLVFDVESIVPSLYATFTAFFLQNIRERSNARAHSAAVNRVVRDTKGSGVSGFGSVPVLDNRATINRRGESAAIGATVRDNITSPLEDPGAARGRRGFEGTKERYSLCGVGRLLARGRMERQRSRAAVGSVAPMVRRRWSRELGRIEPHGRNLGNASVPEGRRRSSPSKSPREPIPLPVLFPPPLPSRSRQR